LRFVLLLLLAGCAAADRSLSDWQRQQPQRETGSQPAAAEENVAPPAYPAAKNLVEFSIDDPGGFRYFVDRATLSVGKDGVVRYVLVARSAAAQNVSFEGFRCATGEHRVFALGRATGGAEGTWARSFSGWHSITAAQPRHITLFREFLCPQKEPVASAREGVRALERGVRPESGR
jgi:hypothetical protein